MNTFYTVTGVTILGASVTVIALDASPVRATGYAGIGALATFGALSAWRSVSTAVKDLLEPGRGEG